MGFVLNVNGEQVWSTDQTVSRIGLQTSQGEEGAVNVDPSQVAANVVIEFLPNTGTPHITDVEQAQNPANVTPEQAQAAQDAIQAGREQAGVDPAAQAANLTASSLTQTADGTDQTQATVDAVASAQSAAAAQGIPASEAVPGVTDATPAPENSARDITIHDPSGDDTVSS